MYKISILAAVTAFILVFSAVSISVNGAHEPDGPYIQVTGKLFPRNLVSYKFVADNDVPKEYKVDARKALKSWKNALQDYAPQGEWIFTKNKINGVTDMVVRLSYDETGSAPFCINNADSEGIDVEILAFLKPLIVSAYAEPLDPQRRTTMWIIYVGCGEQMFSHSNIERQVAHVIGHALGMGSAFDGAKSVMCHYKEGRNDCSQSLVPTVFDAKCIVALYGEQGFVGPDAHQRPEFCT